ncbi:MAG TPA: DUF5683 domain-containing protein [Bacteroidales bacterium]|nr:DUF5683 domain-containing protein [Bacteroidales bacterium]
MILFGYPSTQLFPQQDLSFRKNSPVPAKAVLYSAICPGLGQIYNRKYWKLPFIYGAETAFAYSFGYNQMKLEKFKKALFEGKDTAKIDGRTYTNISGGKDYYRRYRDISLIGLAAVYFLNIIDAMVDAHFAYFDISDDLSMNIQPAIIESHGKASPGFSIQLRY